jgi:hypothetical protein
MRIHLGSHLLWVSPNSPKNIPPPPRTSLQRCSGLCYMVDRVWMRSRHRGYLWICLRDLFVAGCGDDETPLFGVFMDSLGVSFFIGTSNPSKNMPITRTSLQRCSGFCYMVDRVWMRSRHRGHLWIRLGYHFLLAPPTPQNISSEMFGVLLYGGWRHPPHISRDGADGVHIP